ncbi:MAG: universal stress protein [Desulfofustis sp.]|nr:universal stress protein [Desulfofustis sp.]
MKRFKKILYILDEVSLSRQGSADKVAELARLNEAQVTVMIAEETEFFDGLSKRIAGSYEELHQAVLAHHRERLDGFLDHERWQDIEVIPNYSESDDFIAIIRKVISESYDMVIKEATLEQGIDQLSMRLVRKCPCPVWVMKYDSTDFKRILAAVDIGEDYPETEALNKKIVELTHSLAQREGGEAHYLHSWRLEYEVMLRGPRFKISPEEIFEIKKELFNERQTKLSKLLQDNHIIYEERQVHLREGVSSEVIQLAISEFDIDVVVMGSVGRSGIPGLLIGNKAEKLLNSINCTVLTVKPDGFKTPVTLD